MPSKANVQQSMFVTLSTSNKAKRSWQEKSTSWDEEEEKEKGQEEEEELSQEDSDDNES